MGLLTRLSAWLADLFGGGNGEESPDASAKGDADRGEGDRTGAAEGPSSGLDPNATTEVRTDTTDDAVDALRDLRQARNTASGSNDGSTATADHSSAADGDHTPDDDADPDRS
ncbi:hypothetical protein [Halorubrum sp. DTA46]|uniref:hypothetical protein n=1 Tax=Halorubrum sp. DTA46 TaxID=3402162 RepID=UPI003AAC9555